MGKLSDERTSVTWVPPLGELELASVDALELVSVDALELAPVEVSDLQREVSIGQQKSSVSHALSPNVISRIENVNPALPVDIFGYLIFITGIPDGKIFRHSR